MFSGLRIPIIVAPMAGGASTPELVAAASRAGAFGFLAGGMATPGTLDAQMTRTKELTGSPFGVNLFVPRDPFDVDLERYAERMRPEAGAYGTAPGDPTWDDDSYPAKLDAVVAQRVPVVSFTFALPKAADVERVRGYGGSVVITVATPDEARDAAAVGADCLCVQGMDGGGHRGGLSDDGSHPAGGELYGVLAALRLVQAEVDLPVVAAGGLIHGADVAAVLAAGAVAAQLGTAFLRARESGLAPAYRAALASADRPTAITRAFSGRPARGLVNRFLADHSADAPVGYPQVNNLTRPIRAAAAAAGDPEALSLWAGQTYSLGQEAPATEIIATLVEQARQALNAARHRL